MKIRKWRDIRRSRNDPERTARIEARVQAELLETKKTQACPECGGPMVYESRPDTIEYRGQSQTLQMLAWWCTQCTEAIFGGKPLVDREDAYLEWKAEIDEALSKPE